MNYYQVLGLNRKDNPTKDDIKKAYRKLAKEWHPDRNKSEEATSKFQEIQKAYDTLYDDNKRKEYDMELDGFNWNNLFNNNGSSSNANSNAGPSFNPDDLFKDLFSFINTNKSQQNKKNQIRNLISLVMIILVSLIKILVREELLHLILTKVNLQNN